MKVCFLTACLLLAMAHQAPAHQAPAEHHGPVCGGTGASKVPDDETHKITLEIKPKVEEKTGHKYTTFTPVSTRTQLVNGVNHFIKVHIGDEKYLHLRVYKTFQGVTSLHGVQVDKKKDDELAYFEAAH